jgi:hypothetical protein
MRVPKRKGGASWVDASGRYGANVFPSPPMTTWLELFVDALKDPIIMVS